MGDRDRRISGHVQEVLQRNPTLVALAPTFEKYNPSEESEHDCQMDMVPRLKAKYYTWFDSGGFLDFFYRKTIEGVGDERDVGAAEREHDPEVIGESPGPVGVFGMA